MDVSRQREEDAAAAGGRHVPASRAGSGRGRERGRERGQEPARPSPAALAERGTGPRGLPGHGRERRLGFPPPSSSSFPGDFDPRFRPRPAGADGSGAVAGSGLVPPAASLPQRRGRWRTRGGSKGAPEPLGSAGRVRNPARGALVTLPPPARGFCPLPMCLHSAALLLTWSALFPWSARDCHPGSEARGSNASAGFSSHKTLHVSVLLPICPGAEQTREGTGVQRSRRRRRSHVVFARPYRRGGRRGCFARRLPAGLGRPPAPSREAAPPQGPAAAFARGPAVGAPGAAAGGLDGSQDLGGDEEGRCRTWKGVWGEGGREVQPGRCENNATSPPRLAANLSQTLERQRQT